MKLHPVAREIFTIFMQALGLLPMQPARVRAEDRFDSSAYSDRDANSHD